MILVCLDREECGHNEPLDPDEDPDFICPICFGPALPCRSSFDLETKEENEEETE